MSLFSVHKSVHPTTAVEFSLYCDFLGYNGRQLIVGGANVLKVYQLVPEQTSVECETSPSEDTLYASSENDGGVGGADCRHVKMRLTCVWSSCDAAAASWLHGRLLAVAAVRPADARRSLLLLAFGAARLVLAEFWPRTHQLRAVSMHSFEHDQYNIGSCEMHTPILRVDPDNRCAVMLVYGQQLAILPFRKEVVSHTSSNDTSDGGGGGARRSPVLPTYVVDLASLHTPISNVVDMQFLSGYYEPTLAILFEPLRTYSGRLAVRRDTCHFVAVSLNTSERVHPVIWSTSNLPHDCLGLISVPRPIGGCLVLAVNSLFYLNQSVPTLALALNSLAPTTTSVPLKSMQNVQLTLDCSQCTFIGADQLLFSLKSGELYLATLVTDGMRAVRNIQLDRAANSVLTSCMTVCDGRYLFLGSRLGNSLLLRIQERSGESDAPGVAKRRKIQDLLAETRGGGRTLDLEELEVYGSEDVGPTTIKQYSFEVCDSLMNISPCGQLVMGHPAFLSEEFSGATADEPDIELVATSGYGKNGALSVLQRSIRPQVVSTFELPLCDDMWTVIGPTSPPSSASASTASGPQHAFLLLTQQQARDQDQDSDGRDGTGGRTMVLQTDESINELDASGFDTQHRTVLAANLDNNRLIVQVTINRVLLLRGSQLVCAVRSPLEGAIVAASVAHPYTIVFSDRSQMALFTLVGEQLHVSVPRTLDTADVVALTAFVDESGALSAEAPANTHEVDTGSEQAAATAGCVGADASESTQPTLNTATTLDMDDEDEMLYGDSSVTTAPSTSHHPSSYDSYNVLESWRRWRRNMRNSSPSAWALLARRCGDVSLLRLPDLSEVTRLSGLGDGRHVLSDVRETDNTTPSVSDTTTTTTDDDARQEDDNEPTPLIHELVVTCAGHMRSRLMLTALVDRQLLVYEAVSCHVAAPNSPQLRFRRIRHDVVFSDKSRSHTNGGGRQDNDVMCDVSSDGIRRRQLRVFDNVAGFNGVFVCGANPHWLLMTSRGELRCHRMSIDGRVTCFAGFNNVNCPLGFLYFNRQGELRVCVLPGHLWYDAAWPVRKVALRRTPHYLTYHLASRTHLVCTSLAQPSMKIYKFTGDDKELSIEDRGECFPYPLQKTYTIDLYSPVSWEPVPNARIELAEWEIVSAMKNVSLSYEGHRSGQRAYVAVATNFSYGEDVVCHGKVILLDVIDVVPEPGRPLTRHKLKTLLQKEQSAPVTAVGCVCGHLLGAVGQKLYVWTLKDGDLVGLAFIDTQIHVHQLHSSRSLIIAGDVVNSVCVLRFQRDFRTLSVVGRDFKPRDICAVEFMIDNTQIGFMTTDAECNLLVFVYQPESRDSSGGIRLIRRSDFQLGSRVHSMLRIRCRQSDTSGELKHAPVLAKRHITVYGNLDGGLGMVVPLTEKTYRRLLSLQNLLISHGSHWLGLNPRYFRAYRSRRHEMAPPARGVLDGDLLAGFWWASRGERRQMARRCGCSCQAIASDLALLNQLMAHF